MNETNKDNVILSPELQKQIKEMSASMRKWETNIKSILEKSITSEPKNIPKSIKEVYKPIKIDFNPDTLFKAAEKMGNYGWTIPFSLPVGYVSSIGKNIPTRENINSFFMEFYSKEENSNFERLIRDIMQRDVIKKWHPALKQCIEAHRNGMFILSIGTLLPVLEGILSTFEEDKENIRMKKICTNMLESYKDGPFVDKLMWTSCKHFINALYEKSKFSEAEPEIINRHWILHGRTAFNNLEVDSLRIFCAIETVSKLIVLFNKNKPISEN